ncbi:unnamed protein product [Allacma fusca]|uniref:Peptidase aspartic putative domain-containing protein n=1 Tax=Allacma fusca TaxID=39272 RepID=A0A8J2L1P6_9HEXA|nr:unnamed protein product [Allacma fusca]
MEHNYEEFMAAADPTAVDDITKQYYEITETQPEKASTLSTNTATGITSQSNLTPTAVVSIANHEGVGVNCRALIDNCSDVTFIQESLVRALSLVPEKLPQKQIKFDVKTFLTKSIGGAYPQEKIDPYHWIHLPTTELADPEYFLPKKVELLMSTDLHYEVIRSGIIRGKLGEPVAHESSFGWLVGGGTSAQPTKPRCNLTDSLYIQLQQFWDVEHGPAEQILLTAEETLCQLHYDRTTVRFDYGSYQVELPVKESCPSLGNSSSMALKRFYALEKKFSRNEKLRASYTTAMEDLKDGHMEIVPKEELFQPVYQCYYLPHHARYWKVPLTIDIQQMYLYILVLPDQRNYLRIYWRKGPNDTIKCYRLRKVIFGTASDPYQAVRTLHQLAKNNRKDHPEATEVLCRNFYMDDCMSGANSTEEAILADIPENLRETSLPLSLEQDDFMKALGLIWSPIQDEFRFEVQATTPVPTTKRKILSQIAKVFDPLGFLAPVTVREEIEALKQLRIPRWIRTSEPVKFQIIGFSYASEKAFAAAVYLRILTTTHATVQLEAAKTRVAPTKEQSLPKLELCGAVLLAQLITTVKSALQIVSTNVFAFTVSTITLAWITADQPQRWKTFVRNRLWFNIPEFLQSLVEKPMCIKTTKEPTQNCEKEGKSFPSLKPHHLKQFLAEKRPDHQTVLLVNQISSTQPNLHEILQQYSNWNRLIHHVSWWIFLWRYHLNRQSKQHTEVLSCLNTATLQHTEERIVFVLQQSAFPEEVKALQKQKRLNKKSSLLSLSPFLQNGLLMVGGRIKMADFLLTLGTGCSLESIM